MLLQAIQSSLPLTKNASVEIQPDVPMWQRPVSSTVGRAMSPLYALFIGNTAPLKPGPTSADMEILKKYEGHLDGDVPLKVYPNRTPLFPVMRDIWKNPRIGPAEKAMGLLTQPLMSGYASLTRADHYNPLANSVHSYTNHDAIKLHEVGHAIDFDAANKHGNNPYLAQVIYSLYPAKLYREYRASTNAMRMLDELDIPEEAKEKLIRESSRALHGAFGSYAGSPLGLPGVAAAVAGGQVLGHTQADRSGIFSGELKGPASVKAGKGLVQSGITGALSGAALGGLLGLTPSLAREIRGTQLGANGDRRVNEVLIGGGIGAVLGSVASVLHRKNYNKEYGDFPQ